MLRKCTDDRGHDPWRVAPLPVLWGENAVQFHPVMVSLFVDF